VAELVNLGTEVVDITWYCRYRADLVILPVVGETVDQAVHDPAPGFAFGPDRTWIVTEVPVGAVTSRVSVSQPTTAPASRTFETKVLDAAYVPTRAQSTTSDAASFTESVAMARSTTCGAKASCATWVPSTKNVAVLLAKSTRY
jgi:hypothetical protein